MSFEVAQDTDKPEQTTVESYGVTRLTATTTMRATLVETRRGWTPVVVSAAVDADTDGLFEQLHVPAGAGVAVGDVLFTAEDTLVGTIASIAAVPAAGSALPYQRVTLAAGGGLHSGGRVLLRTPVVNFLGTQVMNPAPAGRTWTLVLSSDNPTHVARMGQMMASIQGTLIARALAVLGVSKTADEVQAAVFEMFANGDSIDSLIASEMEQLEKDRRANLFTSATVLGPAPTPVAG